MQQCEVIIKSPRSPDEEYIIKEELLQQLIFAVYHDGKAAKDNMIHDILKNIRSRTYNAAIKQGVVLDVIIAWYMFVHKNLPDTDPGKIALLHIIQDYKINPKSVIKRGKKESWLKSSDYTMEYSS